MARLGTVAKDGPPHLVPICFLLQGDILWSAIDQKPKRGVRLRRLQNLEQDPHVSILIDSYEEDWSRLWWIRLEGTARIIDGQEKEGKLGLQLLSGKYPQYRQNPPPGPLIRAEIERWTVWEWGAGGAPEERPRR